LDPVAAYLLAWARNANIITRSEAERRAQAYYNEHNQLAADEQLNPDTIKQWGIHNILIPKAQVSYPKPLKVIAVTLLRDFGNTSQSEFRVLPAEKDDRILWFDAAGFLLAESERPTEWNADWIRTQDFHLNHIRKQVRVELYL
jgi:hypothetical protein